MTWEISRRAAMFGTAAGLVGAGITIRSTSVKARTPKLVIIEESSIPESRQFCEALMEGDHHAEIVRIDRSLNGLLDQLSDSSACFVGLTSDPAAMIASQLLLERGGQPHLEGKHLYTQGRWMHHTNGTSSLLERASNGWPTALAFHIRDLMDGSINDHTAECRSGACNLAASSPGALVSWAIEVEDHLS